jgi:hypothetical protein
MGYGHRVCQDYARAGPGYAIVSDGCSGAKDSDIGARLLVLAAEQSIHCFKEPDDAELFVTKVVISAAASARAMSLKEDCLDATLMILKAVGDTVWAIIYGDGFLVYKLRGETWCEQVKYGEFPNYPSYRLSPSRKAQVKEGSVNTSLVDGSEELFKTIEWAKIGKTKTVPLKGDFFCMQLPAGTGSLSFAAVFTDGLGSFTQRADTETSKTDSPVPFDQVLPDLVAFRGTQGAFVQRRYQKFIREQEKMLQNHFDDLGIGVIAFGDEP